MVPLKFMTAIYKNFLLKYLKSNWIYLPKLWMKFLRLWNNQLSKKWLETFVQKLGIVRALLLAQRYEAKSSDINKSVSLEEF